MRNMATDEAGTSAPEPVTLVVALLVHVDTQWLPAVRELRHLFGQVPAQYHEGFAFHAKWISAANKYPDWKEKDRTEFMCSVMNLPGTFNIPIALGAMKRGASDWSEWAEKKMTPEKVDHFMAFTMCMARADHFLRTYCGYEMGQPSSRARILRLGWHR